MNRRQRALLAALSPNWPRLGVPEGTPERLGALAARAGKVAAYDRTALRDRLRDPLAFALRLRRADGAAAFAVVPAGMAIDCSRKVFRQRQGRLGAPRPPTRAEQGVCAFIAAAFLDLYGIDGVEVEVWHEPPPALPAVMGEWTLGVELTLEAAGVRGAVFLLASESVAIAPPKDPPALADLLALRGDWLDGLRIDAPVVSGVGRVAMRELLALARRDVLVLDQPPRAGCGRLAVGAGGFPVTLGTASSGQQAGDCVTIAGPYERGGIMSEGIADDVSVEIACQVGTVRTNARRVLELAPGQVLPLERPLGGPVDLVVGSRVVGRGELVDVDGELGVRVLSLEHRAV